MNAKSLTASASLFSIRNRLTALKKDRGEFIKAHNVLSIYQAVVKQGTVLAIGALSNIHIYYQVTRLNDVRDEQQPHKNRLDITLADVFSLMSLFFLTIGKTKECPATYCKIATIRVRSMYSSGHVFNTSD